MNNYTRHHKIFAWAALALIGTVLAVPNLFRNTFIPLHDKVKLADLSKAGSNDLRFTSPASQKIWLVIGVKNQNVSNLSGALNLCSNGVTIYKKSFYIKDLKSCTWLRVRDGLDGYILNYSDSNYFEGWPLVSGQIYDGTVAINNDGTNWMSLWLCWFK